MSSRSVWIFCYALMCTLFYCCSSGNEEDPFSLVGTNTSVAEIAGNWNATQAIFSKKAAGPVVEVDVVADGGSVTLNIQTDGSFSVTVTETGSTPETSSGRLGFDEDLLVISFDDDPDEFEFFSVSHAEPNLSIQ